MSKPLIRPSGQSLLTAPRLLRSQLRNAVAWLVERDHPLSSSTSQLYRLADRRAPRYLPFLSPHESATHTEIAYPSMTAEQLEPRELQQSPKRHTTLIPAIKWSLLRDCECDAYSSVFVDHHVNCARTQVTPSDTIWRGASLKQGMVYTHGHRAALLRTPPSQRVPRAIFCGHAYANNWYHWLIEACSRLHILCRVESEFSDWPMIVPEFLLRDNSLSRLFYLLSAGRDMIALPPNHSCRADQLLWIDLSSVAPPLHFPNATVSPSDHLVHPTAFPDYLEWLRTRIGVPQSMPANKRLFLMRAQQQSDTVRGSIERRNIRVYNQDECLQVAHQFGFEPVWLDKLSLEEQITSIAAAEAIVGPTGAGWANLAFATPHTKALTWTPLATAQLSHYSILAQHTGTDLAYLFFTLPLDDIYSFVSYPGKYYIPPTTLRDSLSQML